MDAKDRIEFSILLLNGPLIIWGTLEIAKHEIIRIEIENDIVILEYYYWRKKRRIETLRKNLKVSLKQTRKINGGAYMEIKLSSPKKRILQFENKTYWTFEQLKYWSDSINENSIA